MESPPADDKAALIGGDCPLSVVVVVRVVRWSRVRVHGYAGPQVGVLQHILYRTRFDLWRTLVGKCSFDSWRTLSLVAIIISDRTHFRTRTITYWTSKFMDNYLFELRTKWTNRGQTNSNRRSSQELCMQITVN